MWNSWFLAAFPTQEKRLDALMFCLPEIFVYLEDNLKLTPQSMSDLAAASDELAEMHQRVISSSLLALATLLDALVGMNSERLDIEGSNAERKHVKVRAMAASSAKSLLVAHRHFLDFLRSESPVIRSATYSALRSSIKNIPEVFSEGDVKDLSTAVLGAFQEKDPACHTALWETMLLFSKTFPTSWSYVNFQKTVSNRFWQFLRNGCYGSQQLSYPALVLFLDSLPTHVIERKEFFSDFFQNFWAGRNASHPSKADRMAFYLALKECFLWCITNASRHWNDADKNYHFRMSLVDDILVKILWHNFLFNIEIRHEDIVPSGPEEATRMLTKNSLEIKGEELLDLGHCMINILSAMFTLDGQLLIPFCEAFQNNCLETFQQTEDVGGASGNLVRVMMFLTLVEKFAVLKAESWPLDYLVGPMVERSFPLIMSHESPASAKFLSVIVSTFGPRKVIPRFVPSEGSPGGTPTCRDDSEVHSFLKVFEGTFVSWCFSGSEGSVDTRLDLLLALLDDECFNQQWNMIISYATNKPGTLHMRRLATLIKKARYMKKQKSKLDDNQLSQLEHWQHKLLDSIAVSIMQTGPSFMDSGTQFLRAVLGGSTEDDVLSFLSENAVIEIFKEAFRNLLAFVMQSPFDCVRSVCPLAWALTNSSTSATKVSVDVAKMAYFSLEVLGGSLFSLKSYCEESELLPDIAALIFIIDWECIISTASRTEFNNHSMDEIIARQEFGKTMQNFRVQVGREFWRNLPAQFRMALGSRLIQFIRSAIFEQGAFDAGMIASLCCKWVVDVIECLCVNQLEEQKLINLLLSRNAFWPLWVIPGDSADKGNHTLKFQHVPANCISWNHEFAALVDKLILERGVDRVLGDCDEHTLVAESRPDVELVNSGSNISRAWVAAEMLCSWEWPGGSSLGTLLPSLSSYSKTAICSDQISLFDSIVNILLEGALICGGNGQLTFFNIWPLSNKDLDDIKEPFLRALVSVLLTLRNDSVWNQEKAIALSELLVNKLYVGQETDMNCLRILSPLMFVLSQWLYQNKECSNLDEDTSANSFRQTIVKDWLEKSLTFPSLVSWTSGEDKEEWFQLALSCYPISTTKDVGKLKLNPSSLERKLLLDLFHKQRLDANMSAVTNKLRVVPLLLSRLMVIVVACCWEEFDEDDWKFVLSQLRCWIELVVTIMEEAAESLDLETGDESPDCLELTVSKLEKIMMNLDPSIMNVATNALYAFSSVLEIVYSHQLNKSESLMVLETEICCHTIDQIQEGILRIFLSAGVAEAISSSLSCETLSILSGSYHVYPEFWNLIASTTADSSLHAREQTFNAVKLWGLRKDAIGSLMAILFSSKPVSALQLASFVLLTSAPFSNHAVMVENGSDSSNGSSTVDERPTNLDLCVDSSPIREEIHCLVQQLPIQILHMDLEEQQRHIPLELCANQGLKKKDTELPPELADIATAATRSIRTGSVLFAVESLWPVGPEKLALLGAAIFGLMLRVLPAYVRVWFSDLRDRAASSAIESFTKRWCSPQLVSDELSQIKKSDFADECFTVSVSKSANEVIATYTKDDTGMDLVIRLPASYPLRPVDVECTRSLGISEVKQRKWLLSMMAFVRNQNGALAEAIRIWKSNFDKEFEGVEECPICYSVIHTTNHSLPRLACKTCKHKFHAACLYKWFSTSHKSTCPLCQSPF
ncbi:hypothetical protein Cgig2_006475 [Carnegiea gigantea]|uniref:E3 ubiquitin-protein ligase listerin n=1 Tax=Carnegiea gigantea TaxID=171969 RepID=A0A9Q1JVT0_9CARY|nr:hypothetical protein Cgig2_006475 [Carnegiea gigantea]